MNYIKVASSPTFFLFLLKLDESIVAKTAAAGCVYCGGPLHRSNWFRIGFGIPNGCGNEILLRHSFQCGRCRKRTTPNSLRWLYYRRFAICIQLLSSALQQHGAKDAMKFFMESFGVGQSLLRRWRSWWRNTFLVSAFWQSRGFTFREGFESPSCTILRNFEASHDDPSVILRLALRFISGYRSLGLWQANPIACERFWSDQRYQLD